MNKAPKLKHQIPNKFKALNLNAPNSGDYAVWNVASFNNWCLFVIWCLSFGASNVARSVEPFPRTPPTPPDRAEATFEVQHGFRMELIAAEPLVVDPVDLAYDEDGRAYVVEMRDYPYPEEKNAAPTVFPGTVRLLEDTNGDGKFDKSTIFADQLAWPTSVCCYKGGVFVAAAPDVWYFKDTDGDHKADVRRKVFTGFSRYNVQAIMNSLRWGLDNKIYGAAAGNGGTVRHADRPDDPLIQLTRRDFRFDPVTEKIEAISGGERYGATFDDWGNRFLCNIRNPVQHVVLPLHYMQRNPHLIVPSFINDCAESGDQLRVYRISPPETWREFRAQRWALEQANMPRSETIGAGFWTSSSGVSIYRGAAYPEPFRGNVFIGEVAGNLIHRQILTRDGVTFKSRRADENTEFVRSRDNWFRPVNFINAPDGTLTVLDMYRETIEHPWSIPDDIKSQLDLQSGNDRGRLYRLTPPAFSKQKPPNLASCTTDELVAHLENPNSWYRETAQRLLFERQDKSVVESLRELGRQSPQPQARLHGLYMLATWNALTKGDLEVALSDGNPVLRGQGVLLSEPRLKDSSELAARAAALARSDDKTVRFQVALSIANAPPPITIQALVSVALRDAEDPWARAAIISSSPPIADQVLQRIMASASADIQATAGLSSLIRELASAIGAAGNKQSLQELFVGVSQCKFPQFAYAALSGAGQGLSRRRELLSDRLAELSLPIRNQIQKVISSAKREHNTRGVGPSSAWLESLQLFAYLPWSTVRKELVACLKPFEPVQVQQMAIRVLGSFQEAEVASELLACWRHLTPPLRDEAVTVLLSRPIWHEPLIAALEKGDVPISQVSIPQRGRLAAIKDEKLAERAQKILASFAIGPRKEVIDRYQASLSLKGDTTRGQTVYRRECANCHKLRGEGHDVGPSLETVQHRSPQEILIHVLDPNREVSPQFLDYTVRLRDGRVLTGLIAAETDQSLVLRRAQNLQDSFLREDIEEIASSGKSLMPEGVEQKITPQEMADLIRYLRLP
jgi:putative membrane-bound dehydrogenase-like protein